MSTRPTLPRRSVLAAAGSALAAGFVGAPALLGRATATAGTTARLPSDLFTLGVASGDPLPDGVVLWTRLAPDPLNGGGMPQQNVPVQWQVSDSSAFTRVRESGTATARPQDGHSVHVEVRGLQPDREYWYRFRVGTEISPVGRTRTAPAGGADLSQLSFVFASCQSFQDGFYTSWRHAAQEDIAFVAFLGDYIYESVPSATTFRRHEGTGEPCEPYVMIGPCLRLS